MNYPGGEQPLFGQQDLGGYEPPPPPRNTGMIVMFLVVALLLVGAGGVGFLYFNEVQNRASLTSQLTEKDKAVAAANKQVDDVKAQLKAAQDAMAADAAKLKASQDNVSAASAASAAQLKAAQDAAAAAQAQVAQMAKCNDAAKAVVAASKSGADPQQLSDLGAALLTSCGG